jgi:hypothetical protein
MFWNFEPISFKLRVEGKLISYPQWKLTTTATTATITTTTTTVAAAINAVNYATTTTTATITVTICAGTITHNTIYNTFKLRRNNDLAISTVQAYDQLRTSVTL